MEMNNNNNTDPMRSRSSSIGKNSDVSLSRGIGGGCVSVAAADDDEEVQSHYKGALDGLTELVYVLPDDDNNKKGISKYYSGKSKSYANLSDAENCPTIDAIRKPENAYTRKRKNLIAFSTYWDNTECSDSRDSSNDKSKRTAYSRSMVSLEPANSSDSTSGETSFSNSSSPGCSLPSLPPPQA